MYHFLVSLIDAFLVLVCDSWLSAPSRPDRFVGEVENDGFLLGELVELYELIGWLLLMLL
jgi:hypothetical protein